MKRGLTVILAALVLLTGCDGYDNGGYGDGGYGDGGYGDGGYGDGGYGDGGYGDGEDRFVYNLVSMEIADAQSLYLGLPEEKDGVTARDMDGYVLFKITKDGIIAKVKFHYEKEAVGDSEDGNTENGNTENGNTENGNTENGNTENGNTENGNTENGNTEDGNTEDGNTEDGNTEDEDIDILQPQAVWNVNEEYFIVTFRNRDMYTYIPYLVSKKTGAVYSLENVGVPEDYNSMFANSSPVLSDGKNNIYFKIGKYNPDNPDKYAELYRIDVSNPEKVFAKPLTAPKDNQIDAFAVDAAGNVGYLYFGNNTSGFRLALAGGGYKNLNIDSCWTAPDGKLYYMGREWVSDEEAGKSEYPIYRLDINGKEVSKTEYGNLGTGFGMQSDYYLIMGNRAYIIGGVLLEVYNPEGKPRQIKGVPALTNIQAVTQSEEELFIAGESDGEPRVIRVNPMTGAWSDLYTPGDYEVYNMVYAGGRLTVNALRMSDGAIIMGELDETGKMNVLDETSNSKVLYLTRIK